MPYRRRLRFRRSSSRPCAACDLEQSYVKGGYLQIDESPIDVAPLNALMKYATLKAGMVENTFSDSHFRRSDAGQAIYSPFIGNYVVDPFTTEPGADKCDCKTFTPRPPPR
jgi:hypothetical protein